MDMDLAWCPVCDTAIVNPEDARPSAPPSPSDETTPSRATTSAAAAHHALPNKLIKSRQGTIKAAPTTAGAVAGARLRRNGSSGKNLASKLGGMKPFETVDADTTATGAPSRDGTIRRPPGKRVQLVDAKKEPKEQDRPVEGVTGQLYCSEKCRRIDEASYDEDYYHGRWNAPGSSAWNSHRRSASPNGAWGEDNGDYSSASDHYSSGAEGSGSRRYSSGVDSFGRRSNDSISSLNANVGESSYDTAAPPVVTRLGGLRGLRAMTPITGANVDGPSPKLAARPMSMRSKSDDGTAAAGANANGTMANGRGGDRTSRSYDKEMPKRTPLLFAPNGSPLVQPTFPQRHHHHQNHHHAHPHPHHQKNLSMSPGSPTLSTLSRFSDSGASTAPSYHSELRGASSHRDEKLRSLYRDYQPPRRNPSSSSLASNNGGANPAAAYGRSPNDHLAVLSSSLGSFRNLHRPMEQVTPTQSLTSGPQYPGGYSWQNPSVAPSTFTAVTAPGEGQLAPRAGSSSSLASGASRRDSSCSARKGPFRPDLLQAHSDSDTSSPPSSPGYPPLHSPFAGVGSLPHPAIAGVKAAEAGYDLPRSPGAGKKFHHGHHQLSQQQQAQGRSWSWDHLPPYVPQYPAMDVELVRRSQSGIQSAAGQGFVAPSTDDEDEETVERGGKTERRSQSKMGRGATVPMPSKKCLFIFNHDE